MILFCCKTSCLRGDLLRPLLLPNPYLTTLKLDCGHLDDSAIGFLLKPSSHHLSLYNGADFNGRLLSSICTRCNHLRSLYLGSIAEKKVRAIHIFDLQELLTLGSKPSITTLLFGFLFSFFSCIKLVKGLSHVAFSLAQPLWFLSWVV